jgi:thiol:disulfide interchange protein DsbD
MLLSLLLLFAQVPPGPHARVTLVAERSTLQAGAANTIGVRFELDEGWHVYWQNPGDSGAAPTVQWTLPAGFTAGDLVYPTPERIQSGTLTNYGFEHQVLLMAPVRVPAKASGEARISAQVKFIVCREVCVPGRAEPSLVLPVGARGAPTAEQPLFARSRARAPQPAPAAWTSTASIGKDDVTITLTTGKREAKVDFFPITTGIVNDSAAPVYEPIDTGIRIRLERSDQLVTLPSRFPYVVRWPDGHAYRVTARVMQEKAR